MPSDEMQRNDQEVGSSVTEKQPWQFSLRSLLLFTAALAAILGVAKILGEMAFGAGLLALLIVVSVVAYKQSSQIAGMLTPLILIQFVGSALFAPAGGGHWLCWMQRLYLAVDVFLFARLYLFYKIAQRPEPQLSWLVKVAIATSPIWMAVIVTYLMETYNVFR